MKIKFILTKYWFGAAVGLLSLIVVINLFRGLTGSAISESSRTERNLSWDDQKWETWLSDKSELFSALSEGAQLGIAENREANTGLLLTKSANGMKVKRVRNLHALGPGLILTFDESVASDLLAAKTTKQAFHILRDRGMFRKLDIFFLRDENKLEEQGYINFVEQFGGGPITFQSIIFQSDSPTLRGN